MGYIINNTDPFISIKLTDTGRMQLAKGSLNFSYWAIGDSEINYGREEVVNNNPTDVTLSAITRIMRPFDKQPNIKSYITKGSGEPLNTLTGSNIRTVKALVNNKAKERGFFSANTTHTSFVGIDTDNLISNDQIPNSMINGSKTIDIGTGTTAPSVGDFVLFTFTNDVTGSMTSPLLNNAIPVIWYKIHDITGTVITLDRNLPNLTSQSTNSAFAIYKGGEVYDTISTGNTTSYWNAGTLAFSSCCDVTCGEVPIWNMNNIWCEDLAGMDNDIYEGHEYFGSYQYLGAKNPLFEYACEGANTADSNKCEDNGNGVSVSDDVHKSISLIHYTNNTISNVYGEYFHIDNDLNKTVKLHYPTLMYHRRNITNTSGKLMGMTFLASGSTKFVGSTDLEYVDLIEDPSLVNGTPKVVGRVYPQLKAVSIHDDEIVAATSYKSNRNWTLPELACNLNIATYAPSGGDPVGILEPNKTMYLTYTLENDSIGLTSTLPCQKYTKITNTTSNSKDIAFRMENVGSLGFMDKIENGSYDGFGFYARQFKVLYQIVDDINDRPDPKNWNVFDFTTSGLTGSAGETINPQQLENQSPITNGFIITPNTLAGSTTYDLLPILDMAPKTSPNDLQFGDERFFFGNIEAHIGATIYKTFFPITINSGQFDTTSNSTRSKSPSTNPPDIMVSEIGIYDDKKNLVLIGKLSKPTKLLAGNTIMLELSIDF